MSFFKKSIFTVLPILIYLLGCQHFKNDDVVNTENKIPPLNLNRQDYHNYYKFMEDMDLRNIEKSRVDSFEVRIWTQYGTVNFFDLFIIKYANEEWYGYEYNCFQDYVNNRMKVDSFSVKSFPAKAVIDEFLEKINVNNLRQQTIEETEELAKGMHDIMGFIIEIAFHESYFNYYVPCPTYYSDLSGFRDSYEMLYLIKALDKHKIIKLENCSKREKNQGNIINIRNL